MGDKKVILKASEISKSYKSGDEVINIYDKFNLDIYEGEIVALVGPSGCGSALWIVLI